MNTAMQTQAISQTQAFNLIPYQEIEKMARAIVASKMFGIRTIEGAIALCLVAQAEGRHPASCAMDYHIIGTRPALKAETMQARFLAAGGKIEWHEYSDNAAIATFSHPTGGTVKVDWTMERASRIKVEEWEDSEGGARTKRLKALSERQSWRNYGRAMLRARCLSEGIRTIYPVATSGFYTPEEVRDMAPEEKEIGGTTLTSVSNMKAVTPIGTDSPTHRAIEATISDLGLERKGVKLYCKQTWQVESFPELTEGQARELLDLMRRRVEQRKTRTSLKKPEDGQKEQQETGQGEPEAAPSLLIPTLVALETMDLPQIMEMAKHAPPGLTPDEQQVVLEAADVRIRELEGKPTQ